MERKGNCGTLFMVALGIKGGTQKKLTGWDSKQKILSGKEF